ncbi:MAG: hypothetical protein GY820_43290 [Gammaproteobacteria bacterium]|nr:hypothetical protein [Gammaproteobacteria bacterium]
MESITQISMETIERASRTLWIVLSIGFASGSTTKVPTTKVPTTKVPSQRCQRTKVPTDKGANDKGANDKGANDKSANDKSAIDKGDSDKGANKGENGRNGSTSIGRWQLVNGQLVDDSIFLAHQMQRLASTSPEPIWLKFSETATKGVQLGFQI